MKDSAQIVLLTGEFAPFAGGVATHLHRLVEEFQGQGTRVAVVAPRPDGREVAFDRRQLFPIYRVPEPPGPVLRSLARLVGLVRAVRRHRPRMLWAADWRPGVLVALVAWWWRLPLAVNVYGSEVLMAVESPLRRRLARWVFRRADRILPISDYAASTLDILGVSTDRARTVRLGVDLHSGEPSEELVQRLRRRHDLQCRRVLLTLGRLTPRKGHDTVIRALPAILSECPDVVYLVAGTGDDQQRLEDLARDLGVGPKVRFVGRVPEAEKTAYYSLCDVFVMLSRREGWLVEGFGLTFLEAGAQGRPVVAGRHGGVPEAVLDDVTGFLVEPDDPVAAAKAILQLLADPDLAQRLGENAHQWIRREAQWPRVARETLEAIGSFLGH